MRAIYIILAVVCGLGACRGVGSRVEIGHASVVAAVDSLNDRAFEARYRDVATSKRLARQALETIERGGAGDYHGGRAEAWNHLAYADFLTSRFDSTRMWLDSVRSIAADYPGRDVEEAITLITEARLNLRECRYDRAFIIYDSTITIFNSPTRRLLRAAESPHRARRYDWARSEYLIGNAVLDYYYRQTRLPVILRSLDEVKRHQRLHIDTTQLSILYYTYAGSYEVAIGEGVENIFLALDNVETGLGLMADPASRNNHSLANFYQIAGTLMSGANTARWMAGPDSTAIRSRFETLRRDLLADRLGWSARETASADLPLLLLLRSDSLFRTFDDPYQNLASALQIGDYYLARGDSLSAAAYYRDGITSNSIMATRGGSAPIWTSRLYNTLIRNAPDSIRVTTLKRWYDIYTHEKAVIDVNTERDYNTQRERAEAEAFARRALVVAGLILVVCAVVSVLLYYLWKRNRQLRLMQRRLIEQKRMELLTHVVRGISHELSQPLGSITQTLYDTRRDVAELAAGREAISPERYDALVAGIATDLGVIARGKEAIGDLVTSFRNTIRENVVDPEAEFNLADRLDDIVKVVRPGIKSNITLEVDCPAGIKVRTYPLLFSQVVTNLVSNAAQHAFPESDSPKDRIRVVCRAVDRDLVVRCVDNGIGIPPGELERLCQPFVSKKRTNLGLGLSLVKNIVEQYMNGTIVFTSDHGLTVTVTIPGCVTRK